MLIKETTIPFNIGEEAEARTFEKGYRGAWFRCKVRGIKSRNGDVEYCLEYFDFPEEKFGWLKQYQQVPAPGRERLKKKQRALMVRPPYPPVYRKNQMPLLRDISEVVVIVNDSWREGDLVDWWTDDCYWSGRIKELLGDDKAMIEFPQPPFGEGIPDEAASLKDLRPSLDWSPEYGWTVPTPGGETNLPCARLIKPGDSGEEAVAYNTKAGSSPCMSPSSCISVTSLAASEELVCNGAMGLHELSSTSTAQAEAIGTKEANTAFDDRAGSKRKTCSSDTDSCSHKRENRVEHIVEVAEQDLHYSSCPVKKCQASKGMTLNSRCFDKVESAILDLEELVNKVKWLKSILESGIPLSDAARAQWKVVEQVASSSIQNKR